MVPRSTAAPDGLSAFATRTNVEHPDLSGGHKKRPQARSLKAGWLRGFFHQVNALHLVKTDHDTCTRRISEARFSHVEVKPSGFGKVFRNRSIVDAMNHRAVQQRYNNLFSLMSGKLVYR